MDTKERIVSVAINIKGVIASLPAPARHGDVLKALQQLNKIIIRPDRQGFLTSTGRYVNRREGGQIALANNQTLTGSLQWGDELFSEDLW